MAHAVEINLIKRLWQSKKISLVIVLNVKNLDITKAFFYFCSILLQETMDNYPSSVPGQAGVKYVNLFHVALVAISIFFGVISGIEDSVKRRSWSWRRPTTPA